MAKLKAATSHRLLGNVLERPGRCPTKQLNQKILHALAYCLYQCPCGPSCRHTRSTKPGHFRSHASPDFASPVFGGWSIKSPSAASILYQKSYKKSTETNVLSPLASGTLNDLQKSQYGDEQKGRSKNCLCGIRLCERAYAHLELPMVQRLRCAGSIYDNFVEAVARRGASVEATACTD